MKKEYRSLIKQSIASFIIGICIALILLTCFCLSSESNSQTVSVEPVCEPTPVVRTVVAPTPEPEIKSAGICKITAYCVENYPHICNNGDASTTSTGTKPTPGRTVAVDPSVIPYFSNVIIDGHPCTYIAEDTGGSIKGNRVDIVFATHREALDFGVQYAEVSWVK